MCVDGRVVCASVSMQSVVVDVLIEVLNVLARSQWIEHCDAGLRKVALHSRCAVEPRAFKANLVRTLRIGDIDFAATRVYGHVKQDGSHGAVNVAAHEGGCVKGKHIVVGQAQGDQRIPASTQRIFPIRSAPFHDQAGFWGWVPRRIVIWSRYATGGSTGWTRRIKTIRNERFVHDRCLIAGVECGDIYRGAVCREGARGVGEESQYVDGGTANGSARDDCIKDPHVGSADAFQREARISGVAYAPDPRDRAMKSMLSAMRRTDEGAVRGEDDVAWLIADQQGARHHWNGTGQINDADAVREVIHHPHFSVGSRGNGDGFHADGNGRQPGEPCSRYREDFQGVVRRVDRKKPCSIGRQCNGTHMTAFKGHKRRLRICCDSNP